MVGAGGWSASRFPPPLIHISMNKILVENDGFVWKNAINPPSHKFSIMLKKSLFSGIAAIACTALTCDAFTQSPSRAATIISSHESSTCLHGIFDNFKTGGSGNSKESLDDQWEAQQRMLKMRNGSSADKNKYFEKIEKRRFKESKKQNDAWSWQRKEYKKGEDPLTEWKKKRKEGVISDLEDQYGDPKEIGGIPIPGASFGVGGEFGVGGKYP